MTWHIWAIIHSSPLTKVIKMKNEFSLSFYFNTVTIALSIFNALCSIALGNWDAIAHIVLAVAFFMMGKRDGVYQNFFTRRQEIKQLKEFKFQKELLKLEKFIAHQQKHELQEKFASF